MTGGSVAVIGSGVSGLVAAWVLSAERQVTLYEKDSRPGGHADTHKVRLDDGGHLPIDTGFIVHNDRTYPTLLRLFEELGVGTQQSDMSMSVRCVETGLEYAGALGVRGLFPARANLTHPRYLRMLSEVRRFHRAARRLLADPREEQTLRQFLVAEGFSDFFATHFMTPLVSAVWSTNPAMALDYPARYLFEFLDHHGMLSVFGSPTWRTVTGGSKEYVARVVNNLHAVRYASPVSRVRDTGDAVEVTDPTGTRSYDAVVIATHPDQALAMLHEPTRAQEEVLGAIGYTHNHALLHTDTSLLPRHPSARASWNYLRRDDTEAGVLVTYDLSRLMRLPGWQDPDATRYLVTLGGQGVVHPGHVLEEMRYAHPLYTPASVAAQRRLGEIGTDRVVFAGAYHGWGFHEDGALSGRRAAERLGAIWRTDGRSSTLAVSRGTAPVARATASGPQLYESVVRHARGEPVRHWFRYSTYHWLVDLDDLPEFGGAFAGLARRLARFEARDHIGDPHLSIRENLDAFLATHGVDLCGGRIQMLTNARVLGHVFNPITVYWCHYNDSSLAAVVVEVHNTYGDRHAYLVHPDTRGRGQVAKAMYVSPFNDVSGRYDVLLPAPDDRLSLRVTLRREGQASFTATLHGQRRPATVRALLRTALRHPVAPLVGAVRIRWQGFVLWLRRVPVQPRPEEHR